MSDDYFWLTSNNIRLILVARGIKGGFSSNKRGLFSDNAGLLEREKKFFLRFFSRPNKENSQVALR